MKQILLIAGQIEDAYEGDPWFGRNIVTLLSEAGEDIAFEKPGGQHSILELVWHMINWREFTISQLRGDSKDLKYFETNDWALLDHSDKSLWQKGLQRLEQSQVELIEVLQQQEDSLLDKTVAGRNYNFRKLLYGIVQHDIYHAGQIVYIKKLVDGADRRKL